MMRRVTKYRCNLAVWVLVGLPILFGLLMMLIGRAMISVSAAFAG
jgi:uncharacterized membrane protein